MLQMHVPKNTISDDQHHRTHRLKQVQVCAVSQSVRVSTPHEGRRPEHSPCFVAAVVQRLEQRAHWSCRTLGVLTFTWGWVQRRMNKSRRVNDSSDSSYSRVEYKTSNQVVNHRPLWRTLLSSGSSWTSCWSHIDCVIFWDRSFFIGLIQAGWLCWEV